MTKRQSKTAPAPSTTSPALVTADICAKTIALGPRQLSRLVAAGTLPRPVARRYDLLAVVPAYLKYLKDGKQATSAVAAARLRYLEAQGQAVEQRTLARAQELLAAQDVAIAFSSVCTLLAGQLDAGPGRLLAAVIAITGSGEAERMKLHEVLKNEFRRIREATAAELLAWGTDLRGREAAATPSGKNGSGVGARES